MKSKWKPENITALPRAVQPFRSAHQGIQQWISSTEDSMGSFDKNILEMLHSDEIHMGPSVYSYPTKPTILSHYFIKYTIGPHIHQDLESLLEACDPDAHIHLFLYENRMDHQVQASSLAQTIQSSESILGSNDKVKLHLYFKTSARHLTSLSKELRKTEFKNNSLHLLLDTAFTNTDQEYLEFLEFNEGNRSIYFQTFDNKQIQKLFKINAPKQRTQHSIELTQAFQIMAIDLKKLFREDSANIDEVRAKLSKILQLSAKLIQKHLSLKDNLKGLVSNKSKLLLCPWLDQEISSEPKLSLERCRILQHLIDLLNYERRKQTLDNISCHLALYPHHSWKKSSTQSPQYPQHPQEIESQYWKKILDSLPKTIDLTWISRPKPVFVQDKKTEDKNSSSSSSLSSNSTLSPTKMQLVQNCYRLNTQQSQFEIEQFFEDQKVSELRIKENSHFENLEIKALLHLNLSLINQLLLSKKIDKKILETCQSSLKKEQLEDSIAALLLSLLEAAPPNKTQQNESNCLNHILVRKEEYDLEFKESKHLCFLCENCGYSNYELQ